LYAKFVKYDDMEKKLLELSDKYAQLAGKRERRSLKLGDRYEAEGALDESDKDIRDRKVAREKTP
jgi:hypothetical protein